MTLVMRTATREDVPALRALLADDVLGRAREDLTVAGLRCYLDAYDRIASDPRNLLLAAEEAGRVVGTCQITFIPYLSRGGGERAHIEAVRVAADRRGCGIGRAMMEHALGEARRRGCRIAQLTSDKSRTDAHRFYAGLGFRATHDGFKLAL